MTSYPIPENETERISKLFALDILDTTPDSVYDDITKAASIALDMPISLLSLVDTDRQWFKSNVGLEAKETPRDIAFCAYAVYSNKPLIIEDATKDVRFKDNPLVTSDQIRSYLGMPLNISENITLGTLCVISPKPKQFSEQEIELLGHLRDVVVQVLKFREESLSDYLTGIFNRRMFYKIAKKLIFAYKRTQQPFSLIFIDIDHFKSINDQYGHDFGDNILISVAKKIENILRENDFFFRIGGEEFAVLSPTSVNGNALGLAERIRNEVEKFDLQYNGESVNPTISCGVCKYKDTFLSVEGLLKEADKALYQAKESGRNKVVSI